MINISTFFSPNPKKAQKKQQQNIAPQKVIQIAQIPILSQAPILTGTPLNSAFNLLSLDTISNPIWIPNNMQYEYQSEFLPEIQIQPQAYLHSIQNWPQSNTYVDHQQYMQSKPKPRTNSTLMLMTIEDCIKHKLIDKIIATQEGSRHIQKHFSQLNAIQKHQLFHQILPKCVYYARDVFANWVMQLIFETATVEQQTQIIHKLHGHILELCCDPFGCRLIQKAIVVADNSADKANIIHIQILDEIHSHVIECLLNMNAHHVIQCILNVCDQKLCEFILKELTVDPMVLGSDQFGSQIMELIFDKFIIDNRTHSCNQSLHELIFAFIEHMNEMAQHKFGNYIIQDLLESGSVDIQRKMIDVIFENISILAINKYSSNVVEKSIYLANDKQKESVICSLINDVGQNNCLRNIINDKYGNYVLQTLLICSSSSVKYKQLRIAIESSCPNLHSSVYGKHILNTVHKIQNSKYNNHGNRNIDGNHQNRGSYHMYRNSYDNDY